METSWTALPLRRLDQGRTPLPWRNIVHNKVTMFVSAAAVAFAVVIMFMELGFLNGLYDSQTGALRFLRADLVMVSRGLHIFNTHETFPRARLEQVAGFKGVRAAYPIYIEDLVSDLRNPATGIKNSTRVLAFDPRDPIFKSGKLNRMAEALGERMTILFDVRSRSFLGQFEKGTVTELADRAVKVAGKFELGPDYYYDANVLTSIDTFLTIFPHRRRDEIFVGLIQLDKGVSADALLREIRREIGADVEVLTRADIIAREKAMWQKSTPAGYVFTMGVAVGFVIGVFICYQILYTDISDHLPQLATLKALGYQSRDLVRLVLTQAVLLGMLGFVPAVAMTLALYAALTSITGIVTVLTPERIALVFLLTLGMCLVSGLFAVRKALAADPAELF
ncbi:MAG: FtsX-like permease family protein [Chthoniobacterales bacterium]